MKIKNRILILSYRESFSSSIIKCLSHRQYEIIVGGDKKHHKSLLYDPRFSKFIDIPYDFLKENYDDEVYHTIIGIVKNHKINVVMPSDFESLKLLSRIGKLIEKHVDLIPVSGMQTIELLDDKYDCYLFLKNHGIISPKTILIENLQELNQIIGKDIPLPFLIKPRIAAGGEGIIEFSGIFQFEKYIDNLIKNNTRTNDLMVQEYINGLDYCFSGYAYKGVLKAWTIFRYIEFDKNKSKGIFVEFIRDKEIFLIGEKIVRITNYSGPIVIDFRKNLNSGLSYVIEINPRFGNNTYYSLIDGINFLDVGIKLSTQKNYTVQPKYTGLWSCSLKRLFSAPFRKLDYTALPYIIKVGLPQIGNAIKDRYYKFYGFLRQVLSVY